jgi:hypothetical protein
MNKRTATAETLADDIRHYRKTCSLDSWTSFVRELQIPNDLFPALATDRPELLRLAKPRALSEEECKILYDLLGGMLETHWALRAHTMKVAELVDRWNGAFVGLATISRQITDLANFREPVEFEFDKEE